MWPSQNIWTLYGVDFISPYWQDRNFFVWENCISKRKVPLFSFFWWSLNSRKRSGKIVPWVEVYFTATFLFDISNMILRWKCNLQCSSKTGPEAHFRCESLEKSWFTHPDVTFSAKNNWSKLSISKKLWHSKFVFFKTLEGYYAFSGKQSHSDRISWFWFHSTTLTPPGSPGVSRDAKLSTEFKFCTLVR